MGRSLSVVRRSAIASVAAAALVVGVLTPTAAQAKPPGYPFPTYDPVPGSSAAPVDASPAPESSESIVDEEGRLPDPGTYTVELVDAAAPPTEEPTPEGTEPPASPDPSPTPELTPAPTLTPTPTSSPTPELSLAPLGLRASAAAGEVAPTEEPAAEPGPQWRDVGGTGIQVALAVDSASRRAVPELADLSVEVAILSEKEAQKVGADGLVLKLTAADGVAELPVQLRIDSAILSGLYGADFASRVRWVELAPSGASSRSAAATNETPVEQSLGEDGALYVTTTVGASPMLLSAASSPVSDAGTGDFSATPLKPSSSWDVSAQTGGFTWSYPMTVPPAPAGLEPSIGLNYSSQAIDGETGSTNNQPSVVGDGWEVTGGGYIERTYISCSKDGAGAVESSGDLCWKSDNATISFGNRSGTIVRDSTDGTWRLQDDDGSRIERLVGTGAGCSANGTYNTECWRLTTTDGTQYYFGLNQLPGWSTGKTRTDSAWSVPVFGNDAGEPCYSGDFATSWCMQGWRWNLDYIVDVHGNAQAIYYNAESNKYDVNGTTTTEYIRGGSINRIEYGLKSSTVYSSNAATGKVEFGYDTYGRCSDPVRTNCTAQALTSLATVPADASKYPDVPYDLACSAASCPDQLSATFWTVAQLNRVTTKVFTGGAYATVDVWDLGHSFPDPGDGTSAALWLTGVTRTGHSGSTTLTEPSTLFTGTAMQNRVWSVDGLAPLDKYRITSVRLETGGVVSVNYSGQDCTVAEVPTILANVQDNHRRCFPQWWTPDLVYPQPAQLDLFHKYVVTSTVANPVTGGAGSAPLETHYVYTGAPAWRYNDSPFTPEEYRTWSEYAGYDKVEIRVGSASSPATQQTTQYVFYQGMNGDRAAPAGGTKTVTVAGTSIPDDRWLAGRTYQAVVRNGAGGAVASTTVTLPWVSAIGSNNGDEQSRMVRDASVTVTEPLASGANRVTSTVTTYDSLYGLPLTVSDNRESGVISTCTTTSYFHNTTNWVIGAPKDVIVVAKPCGTTPTLPADAISGTYYNYDGAIYGVTKGDLTLVRIEESYTGTTANLATQAEYTYDSMGRQLTSKDALGRVTSTAYTPSASAGAGSGPLQTTVVTNPAPMLWTTTTQVEPRHGNVLSITDPNGKVVTAAYDALGRTSQVWGTDRPVASFPSSPTVAFGYNQSVTIPNSISTTTLTTASTITSYVLYDGLGRSVQSQSLSPSTGTVVKDTEYDSAGRTSVVHNDYWTASVSPSGALFVPMTAAQIPSRTQSQYDGLGRVTDEILVSMGTEKYRTTYAYAGADRTDVVPPSGGTPTRAVVNSLGQQTSLTQYLAATIDPLATQITTLYTYEKHGQMATMKDASNNLWSWTYDLLGRNTVAVDPDSGTTTTTYDLLGRVVTTTDARSKVTYSKYDNLDRKIELRENNATGPLLSAWTYDTLQKGQLTSSTNYVGSTTSAVGLAYATTVGGYDPAYRPTSTTTSIPTGAPAFAGTNYTESITYFQDGSPDTVSIPAVGGLPAEVLRYSYTSIGDLTGLRSSTSTYLSSIGYTPTGQVSQFTRPGSRLTLSVYSYDAATSAITQIADSTLTGSTYSNVGTTTYTRDNFGNITSASTTAAGVATNTRCFTYDKLQNLTAAWTPSSNSCAAAPTSTTLGGPAPYWHTYTVSSITGNRTQDVVKPTTSSGTATTRTYTYPAATSARPHAVSSISTQVGTATPTVTSYGYDAAGNTTSRPGQTLTYDVLGRLTQITIGTNTQKNIYGADGSLLLRTDTVEGNTLFIGMTELRTAAGSTVVTGTRTYTAAGSAIAERRTTAGTSGSTLFWLTTDLVGTSLAQVNASTGAITRRYMDPFGIVKTSSTPWSTNHGYLNAPTSSSTGLTRLGAREYDAQLGRFTTVDPVLAQYSPQQNNGYSYAHNDPVGNSDASGLCAKIRKSSSSVCAPGPQGRTTPTDDGGTPPSPGLPDLDFLDGGKGGEYYWDTSLCEATFAMYCTGVIKRTDRQAALEQRANDMVDELLVAWWLGSFSDVYFDADSPFTRRFIQGASVDAAATGMAELWQSGQWDGSWEQSFDFGVALDEEKSLWFFRDMYNFASHSGNLPESYIGSYTYRAEVIESSPQSITVSVVATNTTTIDSATRIPGTKLNFYPWYWAMSAWENLGFWSPQTQHISWTQEIPLK